MEKKSFALHFQLLFSIYFKKMSWTKWKTNPELSILLSSFPLLSSSFLLLFFSLSFISLEYTQIYSKTRWSCRMWIEKKNSLRWRISFSYCWCRFCLSEVFHSCDFFSFSSLLRMEETLQIFWEITWTRQKSFLSDFYLSFPQCKKYTKIPNHDT